MGEDEKNGDREILELIERVNAEYKDYVALQEPVSLALQPDEPAVDAPSWDQPFGLVIED